MASPYGACPTFFLRGPLFGKSKGRRPLIALLPGRPFGTAGGILTQKSRIAFGTQKVGQAPWPSQRICLNRSAD